MEPNRSVEARIYGNTERFVGDVQVTRDGERVRVRGIREVPRTLPRKAAMFAFGALLVLAGILIGDTPGVPEALILGGISVMVAASFWHAHAPSSAEVSFPASFIRLVEADVVVGVSVRAPTLDPYLLAFEVEDGAGRRSRFDLHAEGPEQIAALLAILTP